MGRSKGTKFGVVTSEENKWKKVAFPAGSETGVLHAVTTLIETDEVLVLWRLCVLLALVRDGKMGLAVPCRQDCNRDHGDLCTYCARYLHDLHFNPVRSPLGETRESGTWRTANAVSPSRTNSSLCAALGTLNRHKLSRGGGGLL